MQRSVLGAFVGGSLLAVAALSFALRQQPPVAPAPPPLAQAGVQPAAAPTQSPEEARAQIERGNAELARQFAANGGGTVTTVGNGEIAFRTIEGTGGATGNSATGNMADPAAPDSGLGQPQLDPRPALDPVPSLDPTPASDRRP